MKTVKFHTFGCKVNQYDTQNIREQFLRAGFVELGRGKPAGIYVVNTCTVTARADTESLVCVRRVRRENPGARIIVTGCLAELDRERIKKERVDLIVKNKDKTIILQKLQSLLDNGHCEDGEGIASPAGSHCEARSAEAISTLTGPARNRLRNLKNAIASPSKIAAVRNDDILPLESAAGISYFEGRTRAFLKVQDGCDNFCSYCKVPLVRGRSVSRPLPEIVDEAKRLVDNGYKEIVLTGICLGSYRYDSHCESRRFLSGRSNLKKKARLVDVISALEKIDGLLRVRLSSIEAGDVTDELISKMASSEKLCPHLHIPIQSGDDDILKRMNRKYTKADYLSLVRKIRRSVPDVAITTDVLVGFPGEGEKNFGNTLELVNDIAPLKAHIFPYSKRPGTSAADFGREISAAETKRRIAALKLAAERCSLQYKSAFLNRKMPVLIEKRSEGSSRFWEGYTANYIRVLAASRRKLANAIIPLKIKEISNNHAMAHFC